MSATRSTNALSAVDLVTAFTSALQLAVEVLDEVSCSLTLPESMVVVGGGGGTEPLGRVRRAAATRAPRAQAPRWRRTRNCTAIQSDEYDALAC